LVLCNLGELALEGGSDTGVLSTFKRDLNSG
jgi:hypothetical protein